MTQVFNLKFKLRRCTRAEWTAKNPVLGQAEPGVEDDTGAFKMGNGITAWNDLPYFVDVGVISSMIQTAIESGPMYQIGDLSELTTTTKDSLVDAINELASIVRQQ